VKRREALLFPQRTANSLSFFLFTFFFSLSPLLPLSLQIKRLQKDVDALRGKWAMAGGLDLEVLSKKFGKTDSRSVGKIRAMAAAQADGTMSESTVGPEDY
jgi:hypothetical protein